MGRRARTPQRKSAPGSRPLLLWARGRLAGDLCQRLTDAPDAVFDAVLLASYGMPLAKLTDGYRKLLVARSSQGRFLSFERPTTLVGPSGS